MKVICLYGSKDVIPFANENNVERITFEYDIDSITSDSVN